MRLLIVEDDDAIAAPLLRAVQREGYEVTRAAAGRPAIDTVAAGGVDLVLLDLGLPDMDGLDVCRQLRADGFAGGIVILTARAGELDRVVGLDVGADDYLSKPFSLSELLARVRALLRRAHRPAVVGAGVPAPDQPGAVAAPVAPAAGAGPAAQPGFRLDRAARRVWVGADELALTAKEFDVLALLDDHRGTVVSRETLMAEVWDENWFGSTKTLRDDRPAAAEAPGPRRPDHAGTVRGVGFRLEDPGPDA